MRENKTIKINLRLTQSEYDMFFTWCKNNGISVSEFLRRLAISWCVQHENE